MDLCQDSPSHPWGLWAAAGAVLSHWSPTAAYIDTRVTGGELANSTVTGGCLHGLFWGGPTMCHRWEAYVTRPDINSLAPGRCSNFNTLRPRRNRCHFAVDMFKCIFVYENVLIAIRISLKFIPKGPINNIPALVQIMAWCDLWSHAGQWVKYNRPSHYTE